MKKIIATLVLCLSALSTPTFAEGFATSAPTTPFYAGVQVGDFESIFGGYQIDKMFSAEAYYTSYNSYATSIGVFGVAMFQNLIAKEPKISFFGKVGIVRTTVDIPQLCVPGFCVGGGTVTSTDLAWGGGAQYDFNKRFSARVGLDNSDFDSELYISGIMRF
jgi:hypothetical protein